MKSKLKEFLSKRHISPQDMITLKKMLDDYRKMLHKVGLGHLDKNK